MQIVLFLSETDLPGDPSYAEVPECPDSKKSQARVAFEIVSANINGEGRQKYVASFCVYNINMPGHTCISVGKVSDIRQAETLDGLNLYFINVFIKYLRTLL